MMTNSSYSHYSKNRGLVSCITALVGLPLMCCCLLGLFYGVFPLLEQSDSANVPLLLILGGLGVFGALFVVALAGIVVWLRKTRDQDAVR